jgi:hypothetical protein
MCPRFFSIVIIVMLLYENPILLECFNFETNDKQQKNVIKLIWFNVFVWFTYVCLWTFST